MGEDLGSIGTIAEGGDLVSTMIGWATSFLDAADYFAGGDFQEALESGFMY